MAANAAVLYEGNVKKNKGDLYLGRPVSSDTAMNTQAGATDRKPNVIVVYVDDLGYADLGVQGSPDARTPHIDALARGGMRFTDGYVSAPQCQPSRAGLLTGRIQATFGFETNFGGALDPAAAVLGWGVPQEVKMAPEYMKELGYRTGLIGKWHLGYREDQNPVNRGFDEFFGFMYGGTFFLGRPGGIPLMNGLEPLQLKGEAYLTEWIFENAVDFIHRNHETPFFLQVSHHAPHPMGYRGNPNRMPDFRKYLDRFPDVDEPVRKTMLAMLSAVDDGIPKILNALKEHGIAEDTLIFFASDNGAPTGTDLGKAENASLNHPLTGVKGDLLEGGIRVPFIAYWPGTIAPGSVVSDPIWTLDILPTAIEAAGGTVPPDLDGVSILDLLKTGRQRGLDQRTFFWVYGTQVAARQGNVKTYSPYKGITDRYDLAGNMGEDRSAAFPDALQTQADALEAAMFRWAGGLPEPTWRIFFPEVVSRLFERYDYEGFEQYRPENIKDDPKFNVWRMTRDVYKKSRGMEMHHPNDFASVLENKGQDNSKQ